LQDTAPRAVKERASPEAYTGRVIAIDASMCLYQFLIMIREGSSGSFANLSNKEGQVTSHLVGFLARTIRLMESGIKPVYVFDGAPPELKLGELEARRARRERAGEALEAAREGGEAEDVLRSTKMTVRVTPEQTEQTKRLLRLMGVPVIEAPSEAEATCAGLCKAGKVYASATEDLDCLTFGTRVLIRNLFAVESQKKTIYEVTLAAALEQLGLSMEQFVDFCILCGCDYCDSLKGIGPKTAIGLIQRYGRLEGILAGLASDPQSKVAVPPEFLQRAQAARDFFLECETASPDSAALDWGQPDFENLRKFLVEESSFNEDRVARFLDRLRTARGRTTQQPLDKFFAPRPRPGLGASGRLSAEAERAAAPKPELPLAAASGRKQKRREAEVSPQCSASAKKKTGTAGKRQKC